MKDSESALREGDIHDVRGADADGGARLRQNDELISVNRTLVLDWVRPYLKKKESLADTRHNSVMFYFNLKDSNAYISSKISFLYQRLLLYLIL